MLKYKLLKYNNSNSSYNGYYYARAAHESTVNLEELAEHMASHNSPFSKGTIHGVLKDMVACVNELLLESKKVKLDDLAIFSLGVKSSMVENISDFNPRENILSAHINALGTGVFSKKQLDIKTRFKEVEKYSVEEKEIEKP